MMAWIIDGITRPQWARLQAVYWTNADLLSVGPLGKNVYQNEMILSQENVCKL